MESILTTPVTNTSTQSHYAAAHPGLAAGLRAGAVKKWITNHDAKTNRPSRNGQFGTVGTQVQSPTSLHRISIDITTYQPCVEDDYNF